MVASVSHLVSDSGPTGATSHTTPSFTPTANRILVAWASAGYGAASPDLEITDSAGLTWTTRATTGGSPVNDTQGRLWTADVGGSPSSMTITFDDASSTSNELGYDVVEIAGGDSTTPFASAVTNMQPESGGAVATSRDLETGTLTGVTSGSLRLAFYGVQNNVVSGSFVFDSAPSGWTKLAGAEEVGEWNAQNCYTSTTETSCTTTCSGGSVSYEDIATVIVEVNDGTVVPGGIVVPALSAAYKHLLTR